jgi:hypothetical protein
MRGALYPGEEHISYLIRQYELWQRVKKGNAIEDVVYDAAHARFEKEVPQMWLGLIGGVVFYIVWFWVNTYTKLGTADALMVPMVVAILVLYAIVYYSTGFALYQAYSFVS